MRCEAIDDIACFQYREPGLGSVVGNARITGEASHVEDLSDTPAHSRTKV